MVSASGPEGSRYRSAQPPQWEDAAAVSWPPLALPYRTSSPMRPQAAPAIAACSCVTVSFFLSLCPGQEREMVSRPTAPLHQDWSQLPAGQLPQTGCCELESEKTWGRHEIFTPSRKPLPSRDSCLQGTVADISLQYGCFS